MASSNAGKRAARAYQQRFPGTPYPVALRAVARVDGALQVVIGTDTAGRRRWVDIEERGQGGEGPHLAVVGASQARRYRAVELMIEALAVRPPGRGVQVITLMGTELDQDQAVARITKLMKSRVETLKHAGARDFAALRRRAADLRHSDRHDPVGPDRGAVVVAVDGDAMASPVALDAMELMLRIGRTLDIHTVLAAQRLDQPQLAGLVSGVLTVHDDGMAASWRAGSTTVEVALPACGTGGEDW